MTGDEGARTGGNVQSDQERIVAVMLREGIPLRLSEISEWSGVKRGKAQRIVLNLVDEARVHHHAPYYSLCPHTGRTQGSHDG